MEIDEICRWFDKERSPKLGKDSVAQLYFTFHPRTAFLKTLPSDSEVVDIGAGDGSLSIFRSWPEPIRSDLRLYAYSIEKGKLFDDFSGYEISNWNIDQPDFDGKRFDAVVCAHFIEHIEDPLSLVAWAARKLRKGGRIYLEWPSPNSTSLPARAELEERGVPLIISRFDDDGTHQELPDGDAIVNAMLENGFKLESRGIVRLPWLEDEMLGHYRESEDGFYRQAAFWSYTGWAQYVVAELIDGSAVAEVSAPRLSGRLHQPQAEIASLLHHFKALQAKHAGAVSRIRLLEAQSSSSEQSLARERRLFAEERQQWQDDLSKKLQQLADSDEEKRRVSSAFQQLQRQHEQVLHSRSWRLTKPLRALAAWLRGQ